MSGFDDNPFDDNPFQDPAIQQVTRNTVNNAAKDLEDYNPFDDSPQNQRPTTVPLSPPSDGFDPAVRGAANPPQFGGMSPAVMSPTTQELPPPYASKGPSPQQSQGQPQISTAELQRRQEELERKARELERREEELNQTPYNARRNNWPPLPEKFPVQPCFYQDINVDIPVEFQRIVRYLYYLWVLHAVVLLVNSLVWVLRLIVLHTTHDIEGLLLSLVYLVIFTPVSYLCWFRPAYKAFRADSSFNFMVFFFVFLFQFVMSVVLSIFMSGSCGIVEGIQTINQGGVGGIIVGILVLLCGIAFAGCAAMDLFMLARVHRIYRSTGASFAKAQAEFATGVMRNEHVQGAATNIASEAIRAQMTNATGGGNASNAPRY